MKALVLESYNQLVYREVDCPVPESKEVLVKVRACGICGSDVHGMDGSTGRRIPPVIMGHEAAGEIVETGKSVNEWNIGDRVTFDSTIYPLDDWYTHNGMYNLSDQRKVLGVSPGDYTRNGAMAEYVTIPEHILYRIPDNVSFEEASMVEPLAVATHAIKLSKFNQGDTVLVIGAGMIGLSIVSVLQTRKVGKIIVIEADPSKEKLAREFGADQFILADDKEVSEKILSQTEQRGADLTVEAVGIEETVKAAIEYTRKGGAITLVGNRIPEMTIPVQDIVTRQLSVQGSYAICGEYDEVLNLLAEDKLDVHPLISKVVPLSEGKEWFRRLYKGEKGLNKVILVP